MFVSSFDVVPNVVFHLPIILCCVYLQRSTLPVCLGADFGVRGKLSVLEKVQFSGMVQLIYTILL